MQHIQNKIPSSEQCSRLSKKKTKLTEPALLSGRLSSLYARKASFARFPDLPLKKQLFFAFSPTINFVHEGIFAAREKLDSIFSSGYHVYVWLLSYI